MNFGLIKTFLKKKSVLVIIGVIVVTGGYFGYKSYKTSTAKTTYVTAPAEKGTLTVSVSGTGQVSSSDQIDLKPENPGTVLSVNVKNGQQIDAGTVIGQIDAKDAQKSVRDAESNLESAQIALQKLTAPDNLSVLQGQDAFTNAQQAEQTAEDNLKNIYSDAFTSISDSYLELPTIVTGLNNILAHDYLSANNMRALYGKTGTTYRENAENTYYLADEALQASLKKYTAANRQSDPSTIEALITDANNTTKIIADAVKTTKSLVDFVQSNNNSQSQPNSLNSDESSLSTYTNQINTHLSALINSQSNIQSGKNAVDAAQRTLNEKNQSLNDTQAGADPLDIKAQQIKVRMAQDNLNEAESKLSDYTIRSPISGVIAVLNLKKGDQATAATVAATIITKEQIAEVTLNEVDVAKVKVGQKSTLSFDALPDLSITGVVAEVDAIGTVTQGVVSYKVKIAFDTQNDQIKSGMSVSAAIITDVKQDVLMVPGAAIKTQGQTSTVDILVNGAPQTRNITTGLSNDTMTEVTGDINEGDAVITQTILPNAKTTTTTARTTNTGLPGLGGGAARAGGGAGGGFGR